jgi:hypothetical protein
MGETKHETEYEQKSKYKTHKKEEKKEQEEEREREADVHIHPLKPFWYKHRQFQTKILSSLLQTALGSLSYCLGSNRSERRVLHDLRQTCFLFWARREEMMRR